MKLLSVVLPGAALLCLPALTAPAQTVANATYNDAANATSPSSYVANGNWSTSVNGGTLTATSPASSSLSGDIINVDIGTVPVGTLPSNAGILNLDVTGGFQPQSVINSLTFDKAGMGTNGTPGLSGSVTINSVGGSGFEIGGGGITNNSSFSQDVAAEITATANSTFAGGSAGLVTGTVTLGTNTIATTGTVVIQDNLYSQINSASNYGSIGAIDSPGTYGVAGSGLSIAISTSSNRSYVASVGDFFQIAQGNVAGATADTSDAFTDGLSNNAAVTWVTTLIGKGILFIEPSAGGTTITSGVTLPIGNDTEFNDGTSVTPTAITLAGGKLLTSYETASDYDTVMGSMVQGGTGTIALGTAFSTSRSIIIDSVAAAGNVGGTLAAVTLGANGTTTNTATYGSIISDGGTAMSTPANGTLAIGDSTNRGTVILNGASTYAGGTVIVGGTAQTGNASALGSGQVGLAATASAVLNLNNGPLTVGSLSSTIATPTISAGGSGYTQGALVTITGGGGTGASATVNVNSAGAITSLNVVNFGANYTSAPTSFTIAGAGTGASITAPAYAASSITLGTGTLTIAGTNSAAANYTGVISGATGVIDKTGAGTQILSGANTFGGGLNLQQGRLATGSATAVGTGTVTIGSVGNSATLDLDGQTEVVHALATAGTAASQTITNGASGTTAILNFSGTASTFGGVLQNGAGTTGLTVSSGAFTLSGASNTYTGLTTVNTGTLVLGANNAVTSGNALTTAATGTVNLAGKSGTLGTLTNAGTITSSIAGAALTIGSGSTSTGTLTGTMNLVLNAAGAGAISVNSAANSGTLTNSGGGAGTVTVASVGSTVTSVTQASASSELVLSGTNSSAGPLNIQQGTVRVGTGTSVGTGTVTLGTGTTAGTLDLNGQAEAIDGLASGAATGQTITNSSTTAATVNYSGNTSTFGGVIQNGAGTTGVTVSGGSLTLSGVNTYTGATAINAGSLIVSSTGSTAAGSAVAVNSGTLDVLGKVAGAVTVGTSGILIGSGNGTTTGVTGAVTVNSGGKINLTTDDVIGTLTVGNLSLMGGGGSALSFEIGSSLGQNDKISAGTLTIGTSATTINVANLAGVTNQALATGTYTLISYTNAGVPANSGNLQLSSSTLDGDTLTLVTTATGVDLKVTASAAQSFSNPLPNPINIIAGSTTTVTATLNNNNAAGGTNVAVNLANAGGTGGAVSGLTPATGTITPGNSVGVSGTFTAGTVAGTGKTWSIQNTDTDATPNTTITTGGTVNVYNHSAPTLTVTAGNNQSVFVNGTLANATATLSDTAGNTPAPLDVSGLSNLTGATGSGVVASGGTGTYTSTTLSSATAGIGKTATLGLTAGDQQTIVGHGTLNPLSATVTYNVYTHSAATLVVSGGNNQSVFVGGSLADATLTLSDPGTTVVPLDVNTLSNLTGATGTAVIGTGGTGTYTSTALNSTTAGIGKTLTVSLKAGDEQAITGANALSPLSQTITYNVYTHSAPVLTVTAGNNQSVFVGGTLADATVTLSNPGTTVVPLDVNTLSNLTGATGTAVIGTGGTGTYSSTALSSATAGIGQTVTVGLKAGDEQAITGADPLTSLSQTVTYNVYTHSAATLTIAGGNNQSIITGGTFAAASTTLSNPGTTVVPLDVNTLTNLTGTTGTAVVGTGATATYAVNVASINNTTVGANQTFAVSLKAGDEQSIAQANALATLTQNITYNVYGHAAPTLSGTTLTLGDVHVGYTAPVTSSNSLTVTNGASGQFIVNLKGSATSNGGVSLTAIPAGSNITAGTTSGPITATLAVGQGVGAFATHTYTFGDDSTLSGASADVATSAITIAGEVYSGQGVWNTNGSGSWGTLTTGFGANWGANQGSPGLDPNFVDTDTATFDNTALTAGSTATVSLNGASLSLKAITFNTAGTGVAAYTIAQGSGGTLALNNGAGVATITDSSGDDTISAPIQLNSNAAVSVTHLGDTLTLSGNIAGTATGLTVSGAGAVVLSGTNNTYTGATTVASGTLDVTNAGALGGGGALNLGNTSTLIGDGVTLANTVSITGSVTLGSTTGAGGLVISGPVTLAAGATLTVDSATTIAGAIVSGALTTSGPATLTLTANNSANASPTSVTTGTLVVSNPDFLTGGLVTLSGGAKLDYTGAGASLAQSITVSPGSTATVSNTGAGTLTLSGTLTKADATLVFSGGIFDVTGTITGGTPANFNSDLVVNNGSTLELNGTNNYTGSTFVFGGSKLQDGTGTAPAGTVLTLGNASDGAVTNLFDLDGDNQSVGALDSAGGGTNKVTNGAASGTGTLTLTGLDSDNAAVSSDFAGIIQDGATATTALAITGGAHLLSGVNTYSGGTTLSAGTLVVANSSALGSSNLTQAGGTLMTDNTNHTINVGGNLVQNGGTLVININALPTLGDGTLASNDIVKVQGTATLNGAVALNFVGAGSNIYQKGDAFTVVESNLANTSLTGGLTLGANFTATVINPPGFKISASVMVPPTLTGPANNDNLYVAITSTQLALATIPGVIYTPNQLSIAQYIDANVLEGNLFNLLSSEIGKNPLAAPSLVAQFNPEAFANFNRSATFNNEVFELQELDSYFESQRSARGDFLAGSGQIDASQLTVVDPSMDPALAQVGSRLLAWSPAPIGHGMLSDTTDPVVAGVESKDMQPVAPTGNAVNTFVVGNVVLGQNLSQTDLDHSNTTTGGVQLGADYRITPHLRAGAVFAYNHTDGTLDNNGSSATIDSYAPGAYVSFANNGWYFNLVGSYGFDNFTEDRRVSVGGTSATAHGAPSGDHVTGNLDGGYDFHLANFTFGPIAGVEYTHLDVDSYTEDGAGAMNSDLAVNTQKGDSLRSRVGGHVSYVYQTGKVLLTPHIDASWQHDFMDQSESISANLVSYGGAPFSVTTPHPSRESALIDAGLDAELNGQVSVFGDYLLQAGQVNYLGQSVQGGVKIGF